jgi:integrase
MEARQGRPERCGPRRRSDGGRDRYRSALPREARRVLAAAADRRNGARWSVALAVGIWQSEAIGLRWKYVDLKAGTIEIGWQLRQARYHHGCDDAVSCTAGRHRVLCPRGCMRHQHSADCGDVCMKRGHRCPEVKRPCPKGCTAHARECPQRTGGGWCFTRRKGVKPGRGRAKVTVALPPELVGQLRAHRKQQNAERLAAGDAWQDRDLVFSSRSGTPIDPRADWEDWRSLLAAARVREARVHNARHTGDTLAGTGNRHRGCAADPRALPAQPDAALHPRDGRACAGRR